MRRPRTYLAVTLAVCLSACTKEIETRWLLPPDTAEETDPIHEEKNDEGPTNLVADENECPPASDVIDLSVESSWKLAELAALDEGTPALVRTVIHGDEPVDLRARLVGVLPIDASLPLLMVETDPCDGRWAEWGGVAAGMSGSPIIVQGRLAGAASYWFGSREEAPYLFGATPVELMLQSGSGGASGAGASSSSRLPFLLTGLPAGRVDQILGQDGLPPGTIGVSAGGLVGACFASDRLECATDELVPGSAIAVPLIWGDLFVWAGIGTVTAVEGEQLWAFGHPFMLNGPTALPFMGATVYGVLSDWGFPYKVAEPIGAIQGTITEDRSAAISGHFGADESAGIEVITRWAPMSGDGTVAEARHIVPRTPWSDWLVPEVVAATQDYARDYWLLDASVEMTMTVSFAGSEAVVERVAHIVDYWDVWWSTYDATYMLLDDLREIERRFPEHPITRVEVEGLYFDEPRMARLAGYDLELPDGKLSTSSMTVAPGDTIAAHLDVFDERSFDLRTFDVELGVPVDVLDDLPEDATSTDLTVIIGTDPPASPLRVSEAADRYRRTFEEEIAARNESAVHNGDDDLFVGLYRTDEDGQYEAVAEERIRLGLLVVTDDLVLSTGLTVSSESEGSGDADSGSEDELSQDDVDSE